MVTSMSTTRCRIRIDTSMEQVMITTIMSTTSRYRQLRNIRICTTIDRSLTRICTRLMHIIYTLTESQRYASWCHHCAGRLRVRGSALNSF